MSDYIKPRKPVRRHNLVEGIVTTIFGVVVIVGTIYATYAYALSQGDP
jgi:hypothetical protein